MVDTTAAPRRKVDYPALDDVVADTELHMSFIQNP